MNICKPWGPLKVFMSWWFPALRFCLRNCCVFSTVIFSIPNPSFHLIWSQIILFWYVNCGKATALPLILKHIGHENLGFLGLGTQRNVDAVHMRLRTPILGQIF